MKTTVLPWLELLPENLPSPCFVVDENRLLANLRVLDHVQQRTGATILLALKGFAMFSVFPLLNGTLGGTCASSPHEARLGREKFGKQVHVFAAAYSESDVQEIAGVADHIVFNSFAQWQTLGPVAQAARKQHQAAGIAPPTPLEYGLRINPEHSEGAASIYNPCAPGSRLGIRRAAFTGQNLHGISGLHFHTLCEQDAAPLARTLAVVEEKFGEFLPAMRWLNFGGGHHITKPGYDIELLCECITRTQNRYGVRVYLEPGEAVALHTGVLVSRVLDVIEADMPVALLDTSAPAHMPDVLEMPYRPEVIGAALPGEKPWACRLAGKSCLAGDTIGEYAFDAPLTVGERVVFLDMAHYSMVKTTTFNGLGLPAIALVRHNTHECVMVREFGYHDFMTRLS